MSFSEESEASFDEKDFEILDESYYSCSEAESDFSMNEFEGNLPEVKLNGKSSPEQNLPKSADTVIVPTRTLGLWSNKFLSHLWDFTPIGNHQTGEPLDFGDEAKEQRCQVSPSIERFNPTVLC
eukprot:TRINITY_DN13232_c0_g1_i1.p1 TRINITY_DN13232_c0_g1~~TRINITY_DN13232_c0_g1_i1.p1  ORF type:complete len:124 (-),score=30.12 TRINITY_DN13232_c0_g1_i1:202-573(-)